MVVVEFRDHPSRFPQVTARRVCHTPDIFGKNIVPVLVGQVFTWKEIFDHVPETEYREQTITVVGIRQVVIGFFSVETGIGRPLVIGFVIRLRHVTVPCGSVGRTQPDQTLRKLAAERCRIPNPSDVGAVFENRIRRQYLSRISRALFCTGRSRRSTGPISRCERQERYRLSEAATRKVRNPSRTGRPKMPDGDISRIPTHGPILRGFAA